MATKAKASVNEAAQSFARLTEPAKSDGPPTPARLWAFIGKDGRRRWQVVEAWIAEQYPDVFTPDWLYGGQKHGWSLRYKKSKSFCTLIPERGRCSLLIVLGKEEQRRATDMAGEWSPRTRQRMAEATVYHDGQWLLFPLDDDGQLADATRLLALKRKPKPAKRERE